MVFRPPSVKQFVQHQITLAFIRQAARSHAAVAGKNPFADAAVRQGEVVFDTDTLDVTLDIERLGSITSIPLLEIRR